MGRYHVAVVFSCSSFVVVAGRYGCHVVCDCWVMRVGLGVLPVNLFLLPGSRGYGMIVQLRGFYASDGQNWDGFERLWRGAGGDFLCRHIGVGLLV